MSDEIKIQESPAVPQGAEQALSADAEQKSRSGFTGSQVMRSFPVGVDVTPGTAGPIAPAPNSREAATVSGMAVAAPLGISVKPVDRRTIEGSYPGDTRAQAAPAVLPNQPGPREARGQTKLSGRTPDAGN